MKPWVGCALAIALLGPSPAAAWLMEGHRRVAADAVRALPDEMPAFFRAGGLAVGHSAVDPDTWKLRATPQLRDRESPEHYLDWELLGGRELPLLRSEYLAVLNEIEVSPTAAGFLPYAVVESWQRLVVALAEHRAWPANRHVRAKALVYAGVLAHYAGDVCQPLHTSIHHDGRALADGSSPHTGIHQFVDGLFENAPFDRAAARLGVEVEPFADVAAALLERMTESHGRVDEVYALDAAMRAAPEGEWPAEVSDFARDRYRETTSFLARLFLSAWVESAAVEVPDWAPREGKRERHAASVGSGSS